MKRRSVLPLATAAILALGLTACGQESTDAGGSTSGSASAGTSSDGAPESSGGDPSDVTSVPAGPVIAAYWVAEGPLGPRLAREFLTAPSDDVAGAVALLQGEPDDPDYTNAVSEWIVDAEVDGDEIVATVSGPAPADDPALATQQVVYTLQAAAGDTLPVRFVDGDGTEVTDLGGESNPATAGDPLDTLLLVSISDPAEGASLGGTFEATGRASSFEGTVLWQVRDGDEVVLDGFTTAGGDWATELGPWTATVDLSGLPSGTYTFAAMTDDPSGGTEGPGPSEDTRTIQVVAR